MSDIMNGKVALKQRSNHAGATPCTGGILCGACKASSMEELLASTIFGRTKSNPKKPSKTRNARKPTALASDNAKGDE